MRLHSFIAILCGLTVALSGCERDVAPAKTEQIAVEATDFIPPEVAAVAVDGLDLSVPTEDEAAAIRKKAEVGDADAQARLGRMYRYGKGAAKDYSKALEWFRKGAEQGDAIAQLNLAWMYDIGLGTPKDPAKALEWYGKAAQRGNVHAQSRLGFMYSTGTGVPADQPKAAEWLRKAADQGDGAAQLNLARMYVDGRGVPKDEAKAFEWWQKAAAQGWAPAQFELGLSYYHGTGVSKDASKAAEWLRKASEQGYSDGLFSLGVLYRDGEGVQKDTKKALELHRRAAEQGHAAAQGELGWRYQFGLDVSKDPERAVEWHQKAAAQGYAYSQSALGWLFEVGEGVPKDAAKAVEWYRKAAEQGHAHGQANLGWMYYRGEGVGRDSVLAYSWLNLAAAKSLDGAKERRDLIDLSPEQRAEAERLSSNWKPGQSIGRAGATSEGSTPRDTGTPAKKTAAGTAFIVSKTGHAITNHHVIANCTTLRAEGRDGEVKVVTSDIANDIALLQVSGDITAAATLSDAPGKLRQGEDVVVFGFPLNAVLSSGGNLTPGVVSALTGLGNNTNQIQITAAIQPGSSGSPVLNKKGEVVGVVSMKLSDREMAKATGTLAQNVNFAVSGLTLNAFLQAHKVDYRTGSVFSFSKSNADLADEARKWTLVVECWK